MDKIKDALIAFQNRNKNLGMSQPTYFGPKLEVHTSFFFLRNVVSALRPLVGLPYYRH